MSGGAYGIAVPKMDFSGLTNLGKTLSDQVDGIAKAKLTADLGEKIQAGDFGGAAQVALAGGELQTGLALAKMGETRGASKQLGDTLGSLFGGGAPAAPAGGSFVGGLTGGYKAGAGAQQRPAGPSFAATGGAEGDYLATTRATESGGNDLAANPNSTAKGRYQFTDQTWKGVAARHPDLGLQPGGWRDPEQQERAMQAFTGDNAKALTAAGIPITPGNLYVSHFLGEAGGPKFIAGAMSNPDAPAVAFVSPGAARANRSIFFDADGRPKTAGAVYAERTGRFGGGAPATQVASADAANMPAADAQPAEYAIPPAQSGGRVMTVPSEAPAAASDEAPATSPKPGFTLPAPVALARAGVPMQASAAVARAAPGSPERVGALIRASLIPGLSEQQQGVVKTLLATELEGSKLTSDQREYAMAQSQGFQGDFLAYKNALSGHQDEGSKIAAQGAARDAEIKRLGLDPNSAAMQRYRLTGQVAEDKGEKDEGAKITAQIAAREQAAPGLGLVKGTPAWTAFVGTGKIGRDQELSATDKKAILDADEKVLGIEGTLTSLGRAKQLSKEAYSGPFASARGYLGSIVGLDGANKTQELDNTITAQALDSLKATFGAAPTEGERKILLDIQGSSSQSPQVREAIYARAETAMQKRLAFERARADDLRGGTFYKKEGASTGTRDAKPPSLPVRITPSMTPADISKRYPSGTRLILPDGSEGVVP